MQIRDATLGDAGAIADVHVRTWRDAYKDIVPDDYLASLDVVKRTQRWRDGISAPEGPIRVAVEDDRVIGWACCGPSRDEDDRAAAGELYGIYVNSAFWGTGTGPALMSDALAWLGGQFPDATLWTLERNARARRFYERMGWTADGTEKEWAFGVMEVRYRITF